MTAERDLLSALQRALGLADVDVVELVEQAGADAREEVHATLKRLMVHDLLTRSLETIDGQVHRTAVRPPTEAPQPDRVSREITPDVTDPALGVDAAVTPPTAQEVVGRDGSSRDPGIDLDGDAAGAMTYLFGIVSPDTRVPTDELPALPGGGQLRFIDGPGCRALVCDVDPQLFEVLREPGPDGLDLLAAAAHAHDEILARFAAGPVLPLGLGTALLDDAAVDQVLVEHASLLRDELERVGGHAEWAVTVRMFDVTMPPDPTTDAPESGRAYLERRRSVLDAREDRWELQDRMAAELHGPLAACAVDARRVESRPLEEAAPPLLHGVYLLDEASHSRFESTITYLRTEYPEAVVEVTGPWPPYHFVSLNLAVDGEPRP
jgi:hypothetical protein